MSLDVENIRQAFSIIRPDGGFKTIIIDPPWKFAGGTKGRPQHYPRLSLGEIKALPVGDLAADDCHLFMWVTSPHLRNAFSVAEAWGFRYSARAFVWIKLNPSAAALFFLSGDLHIGQGYTTRKNAEDCLLFKRGNPKRLRKDISEIIISPRREHSRKPEEFYHRVREYSEAQRIELFARQQRPGITAWGNEISKFQGAA